MELFCCIYGIVFYSTCEIAQLLQVDKSREIPERDEAAYPPGTSIEMLIKCDDFHICSKYLVFPSEPVERVPNFSYLYSD